MNALIKLLIILSCFLSITINAQKKDSIDIVNIDFYKKFGFPDSDTKEKKYLDLYSHDSIYWYANDPYEYVILKYIPPIEICESTLQTIHFWTNEDDSLLYKALDIKNLLKKKKWNLSDHSIIGNYFNYNNKKKFIVEKVNDRYFIRAVRRKHHDIID